MVLQLKKFDRWTFGLKDDIIESLKIQGKVVPRSNPTEC
jgi:hypothetical protein